MENLETGKDKIKKICEILKEETLQPAKEEAQKIIEMAEQEARNLIREAEVKAEEVAHQSKTRLAKERELFDASLKQAARQGIETLRQEIENRLFNSALLDWLGQQSPDPKLLAKLIDAIVKAIEKEGTSADFSALIPPQIPSEKVNALLVKDVIEKLREKSVVVGNQAAGIELKLHDRKLTLDLSDEALKELIGQYVRKDFRELLFQA